MPDAHPADLTILETAAALRAGEFSAVELVDAYLDRIAKRDPSYDAWLRVYDERAHESAAAADARLREDPDAATLCGIPLGLKDVIGRRGLPLTADSAVLEGNVAVEDAAVWTRLADEGAVLLGHLHCGEFACGFWGRNPWDPAFSPGGSSSGSAIAVATRTAPGALGTDGRGSVRIPASANGVVGVKPTFGLVSTAGCIPITWTYDVVGPIARTAADASLLLDAMAGPDPRDPATAARRHVGRFPTQARPGPKPLDGVRIGVPRLLEGYLSAGVAEVFARFQDELRQLGAELVAYERPDNPLNDDLGEGAGWRTVLMAEARAIHAQFADRADLYRDEFQALTGLFEQGMGTAIDYVKAQMKRGELVRDWRFVFDEYHLDAVVEPNSADEILKVDEFADVSDPNEILERVYEKDFLGVWSDTQFPVVMVPGGRSPADGGPCGIQIAGPPFSDPHLLQIAIDYQAATPHHLEEPPGLDEPAAADALPEQPARLESGVTQPQYVHTPPITTAVLGGADESR